MVQVDTHTAQVMELLEWELRAHFITHQVRHPGQILFMSLNPFIISWF